MLFEELADKRTWRARHPSMSQASKAARRTVATAVAMVAAPSSREPFGNVNGGRISDTEGREVLGIPTGKASLLSNPRMNRWETPQDEALFQGRPSSHSRGKGSMRLFFAILATAHAFVPGGGSWLRTGSAPQQPPLLSRQPAPICAVTERTAVASDMCVKQMHPSVGPSAAWDMIANVVAPPALQRTAISPPR